jgi:acetyl-CoA synthetase
MAPENSIEVLSTGGVAFPPDAQFSETAHIGSMKEYEQLYKRSVEEPEQFWAEMAEQNLVWSKKWDQVLEYDFYRPSIQWFAGGKLNVSVNCLDRFINTPLRNKAAIIWESDGGSYKTFTYQQLYYEVNRFANVLKKNGVVRGDRVTIYLPMIPELAIAMLACARIGAIHSVVFGGFSAKALMNRIQDCDSTMVITADEGLRGGRFVPLKANADEALLECPLVKRMIVVQRAETGNVDMEPDRDVWWHEEMAAPDISNYCEPVQMDAEDTLFILYTSGSTGKPKGVMHTTAGYLLFVKLTFRWVFDYHDENIHFCTADIGWITGHSYVLYGPLSNGATSLMFEGTPTWPDPGRFWDIVDKHQVNILYTAPTAIRTLMKEGEYWADKHDLSSLRVLGSVGEPINPDVWMWYHKHVGREKLPIVDTWWQTETGGILISPLPGAIAAKPGSATKPFFGIFPEVLKEDGRPAGVNEGGYLVISKPWPGILRGTYGDPGNERFKDVYFNRFPGKYFTGDGARVDEDGDFWLMGRVDDVINIAGHRLGTAEVESALLSHEFVAEAAVVGYPHDIKGEGLYGFVILKDGLRPTEDLKMILASHVRSVIGPIATPDKLQFAPSLPKTRSGKIMRRILRKIAHNQVEDIGDISTLADPAVVDKLVKGKL